MMTTIPNRTSTHFTELILVCFSETQVWQHWISILLFFLFLLTITANITLIVAIYAAPNLHHPLYYCLCLLAIVDLLLSFTISPKILAIVWFDEKTISLEACFSQIFLTFFCQGMESSILLFLAYDRYIAICNPLRYSSIITINFTAQAAALSLTSNTLIMLPFPLIAKSFQFCVGNSVLNCFCECPALAQISCVKPPASSMYALVVLSIILGTLTIGLAFSYTMIIRSVVRLGSAESALKAFSTCSSHLIAIGAVYCILLFSAISIRLDKFIPQYWHILLQILRFLTFPVVNPLVYGIRTKDLRQAIKKLLTKIILYRALEK